MKPGLLYSDSFLVMFRFQTRAAAPPNAPPDCGLPAFILRAFGLTLFVRLMQYQARKSFKVSTDGLKASPGEAGAHSSRRRQLAVTGAHLRFERDAIEKRAGARTDNLISQQLVWISARRICDR